jgi:hypothetical protein
MTFVAVVLTLAAQMGVAPSANIVNAIASTVEFEPAPVFATRTHDAAFLLAYCVGETRCNEVTPAGDKGRAKGPWQLQGQCNSRPVAEHPQCWLDIAKWSVKVCAKLPQPERLAALASGNCEHGHVVARTRHALAMKAVANLATVLGKP